MDETTNPVPAGKNGRTGSLLAIIVILAVIIVGALYFWGQRGTYDLGTNEAVETINAQSDSDEAAAIEVDLEATDVENVDYKLNDINAS